MKPALRYATLRRGCVEKIQERPLLVPPRSWTEAEIQAHWFAGDFGTKLKTTGGSEAEIVQFGVWNREAGPDFAEAAISIDGAAPIRGNIELDLEARDWDRHGHSTNPDYESVALHIFTRNEGARFFTRTTRNRNVPQVRIDPGAISDAPPGPLPLAKLGRCASPLRDLPLETAGEILEAAAQFRMKQKAARLARAVALHGRDEALYQLLATTLGYKTNKLPFTLLAQRLPLAELARSKNDLDALLFGVSGFLAAPDLKKFDPATRGYLRNLWEAWWLRRGGFERIALPAKLWKLSGLRPANHPQRRVAALAQMVRHWPKIRALAGDCDVKKIRAFFDGLHDAYWDFHYTLSSKPSRKPMALVGESRVTEMLANVFFPLAILSDTSRWSSYRELPVSLTNRRVETAAARLFGQKPRRLLRTAAAQQGLLQIYEDFCMRDQSDCALCRFPAQIAQWT